MSKTLTVLPLLFLSLSFGLAGCKDHSSDALDPMTGDLVSQQVTSQPLIGLKVGESLYVTSDRLRVRNRPEINEDNITGAINLADEVIITELPDSNSDFVGVNIPSQPELRPAYVGKAYLSRQRPAQARSLFIIQNIATETSRVYEKCSGDRCAHKLILETQNVVGDNTRAKRTLLGSYKITDWFKFYEDGDRRYPSWYHPRYPKAPSPTDPVEFWFERRFMPRGQGEIRGGFGWYAAYIGPDASAQWLHGTYGWGANKKDFIQKTRSHGCTRFDNESIAYVRHLTQIGTPVLRIYAREAIGQEPPAGAAKAVWPYILTNEDAQSSSHDDSDRETVLRKGIPKSHWLEEGTYLINSNPHVVAITQQQSPTQKSTIHGNGNTYGINTQAMQGIYWVETGRLENYQHPEGLEVGGYQDLLVPNYMRKF